ncbi:MAG: D-glycerate dehydrogenase [Rectinema sp.]|nr:D-glycerate dehydrogenase [Rectinema sp.]
MLKVYVTRLIPEIGLSMLRKHFNVEVNPEDRPLTRQELLAHVADADGVVCLLTDRIDAEVFDTAKRARGFANFAVGFDNMDVEEATRRKIPLSNTPGVLTHATADMAWALLFAAARRVVESDAVMRSGAWKGWGPLQFIGQDVTGATLGVVGAGRIGHAFAMKSRGFDMRVLYCDERPNEELERALGARRVTLETLLKEADFVSIHVPLTPSTRHLIDEHALRLMKSNAVLINTSRGPVVDEQALVRALKEQWIAAAGLDVYENEPYAAPGLSELSNVVMTPHTASATTASRNGMAIKAATNLIAMLEGKRPPDCINPEIYEGK